MIDLTASCAREMGQEPYYLYRQKNMAGNFENVGYSRPGKACIYNILIMEEKQTIVACGAGDYHKGGISGGEPAGAGGEREGSEKLRGAYR